MNLQTSLIIVLLNAICFVSFAQEADKPLKIGDTYQGGIVFFVDNTGQHGLIAAKEDQTASKIAWGPNGETFALSPDDGMKNTLKIVEYHKNSSKYGGKTAADICYSLNHEGYDDWYLPAIDELQLMYNNRALIGNFLNGDYCSSTEYGNKDAWNIHFRPHKRVQFYYNKVDRDYFVRCIRAF